MGEIPLGMPSVRLLLFDVSTFSIVVFFLFFYPRERKYLKDFPFLKQFLLFFAIACFSLAVNCFRLTLPETLISSLYLIRLGIYLSFTAVCFSLCKAKIIPVHILKVYLLGLGSAVAILGIVQLFLYPSLRNLYYLGWDEHLNRAFGSFFDPGYFGFLLSIHSLVGVDLIMKAKKRIIQYIYIGMTGICFLGVILSHARSAYLAFIVGFIVLFGLRKGVKFLLISLIFIAVVIALFSLSPQEGIRLNRITSSWARIESWQHALTIFKDHPLFGVGYNSYRYAQRDYGFLDNGWETSHAGAGSDSSFLLVAATMGIVGIGSFLYLWGSILLRSYREKHWLILSAVTAVLVNSFFINSLFYSWVLFILGFILAFSFCDVNRKE